ncbi:uncharacterized protein LOC577782 [Strongylocentrotus purpuratus]|uniref:C1q domain-containing protein n=1 Tax=Strongylocentrotus purpuratus TaxID=7668 RepID=A0A7M7RB82_STRPU|nr:uncharacterized protein LOC577782 [Strongylocentrotus purpuratus]
MSSTTSWRHLFFAAVVMSMVMEGRTDPVAILTNRLNNFERSMRTMSNMMLGRIMNLENQNRAQTRTLTTLSGDTNERMDELSRTNAELRQQNADLQTMLGTFERFFGSLLVDNPDAFDQSRGAVERIDSLNAFLGNRAAILAGLRPDPATVPTNDTVDQEELGRVLTQLSSVNSNLEQKVSKLERRVDNGAEAAGDRSLTGGTNDIFTLDHCRDGLVTLEATVNALTTTQLDKDNADRLAGSRDVISAGDRAILEGSVYGSARGVNSVRKSVFSVASTRPLLGSTEATTVPFDYVFVNKGDHWNGTNQNFVCGITGIYWFHFSLRSYDGHYMGVTMMKNDEVVTAMYTEKSARNVMESQGVVLPLEIGDKVYLRLGPSTEFAVHSDAYKYATFSGFLVYKGR